MDPRGSHFENCLGYPSCAMSGINHVCAIRIRAIYQWQNVWKKEKKKKKKRGRERERERKDPRCHGNVPKPDLRGEFKRRHKIQHADCISNGETAKIKIYHADFNRPPPLWKSLINESNRSFISHNSTLWWAYHFCGSNVEIAFWEYCFNCL